MLKISLAVTSCPFASPHPGLDPNARFPPLASRPSPPTARSARSQRLPRRLVSCEVLKTQQQAAQALNASAVAAAAGT